MTVTHWILAIHDSECDQTKLVKLYGSENDVKEAMAKMILADKENDPDNWDDDISYINAGEISKYDNEVLYGCAAFFHHHIDYTAWREDYIPSKEGAS